MNDETTILEGKLEDLEVPGAVVEVDPDEAQQMGAFVEDALTEEEALDSVFDSEVD